MDFLSNQFFRKQAKKFSRRFFLPRPVPPAVHFLKIQQNSHSVVKYGSAAAGRSGCAVERAAGVVLPDAPPGQETGVTVSWEDICRYLDSLAVRGRQRETIQVYRPKL